MPSDFRKGPPRPQDAVEPIGAGTHPHDIVDPDEIGDALTALAEVGDPISIYHHDLMEPVMARFLSVDPELPHFVIQLNEGSSLPPGECTFVAWLRGAKFQFKLDDPHWNALPEQPTLVRMHSIDLMRTEFHDPYGPISPSPSVQRKNAFRLEADHPVIVYCYMETIWGGEAWTPLPVESWGTEYYAAAVPGDVVSNVYVVNRQIRTRAQPAPSEIVIVAAWDDTQVSVYPNGPVLSPPSVMLSAISTYRSKSMGENRSCCESCSAASKGRSTRLALAT